MRIVAWRTLKDFIAREPAASIGLNSWYHEAKAGDWKTLADIKEKHRNASILNGGQVVFNLAANKFRLVTAINYKIGIVCIKFVGTHEQYEQIDARKIQHDRNKADKE